MSVIQINNTQKNIKIIFLAVLLIKLFVLTINLVRKLVCAEEKNAAYKFIKSVLSEYSYCRKVIKRHFSKNLIMSPEEEERFQLSNICWICNKLFDVSDNKVRDHCHVTGKYRGAAHWSCNVNLKMTKKVLAMFHNLEGFDSPLIFKELSKFNVKIIVIPNGLEKCMAFTINRKIVFIDSMQFMKSSPDSLVKNLGDRDFKYLSEEYSGELLGLVKEKRVYPYEYMDSFKRFNEDKLPDKCEFFSLLKDKFISEKKYQKAINVWNALKIKTMGEYHDFYLKTDVL